MSERYTVTLGEYKGLKLTAVPVEVTQEEIDAFVQQEREHNATLTPIKEPASKGCIVNIDYTGTVDGVPFDGGSAKGYDLELGSGTFIPGFEAQLVGAKRGDKVDVNVTFPENYHAAELAGKPAVFHVTVNSVQLKHLPNMTDAFVRSFAPERRKPHRYRSAAECPSPHFPDWCGHRFLFAGECAA